MSAGKLVKFLFIPELRRGPIEARALGWAIKTGDKTAVQLLLKKGVSPSMSLHNQPALCLATATGNASIVRLLLDFGANIEATSAPRFGHGWGFWPALYIAN